jgi:hypothetical protein
MMTTTVNGNFQGYWYQDGYLRTTCKEFNLNNVTNRLVHLTNDAVQKRGADYGRFESGNKVRKLQLRFSYITFLFVISGFVQRLLKVP